MKKIVALLLAALLLLSCTACSQNSTQKQKTTPEAENTDTPEVDAEEELEPYIFALYAPLTGDNSQYGLT